MNLSSGLMMLPANLPGWHRHSSLMMLPANLPGWHLLSANLPGFYLLLRRIFAAASLPLPNGRTAKRRNILMPGNFRGFPVTSIGHFLQVLPMALTTALRKQFGLTVDGLTRRRRCNVHGCIRVVPMMLNHHTLCQHLLDLFSDWSMTHLRYHLEGHNLC